MEKPTSEHAPIAKVAVLSSPLRSVLDYLNPGLALLPGQRVQVSFRNKRVYGVVVGCSQQTAVSRSKLKSIAQVLDNQPVINDDILKLLTWAASYYHHAIGEVFGMALPAAMRKGADKSPANQYCWQLSKKGKQVSQDQLKRSPRQAELLAWLVQQDGPVFESALNEQFSNWRDPMRRLIAKGFAEKQPLSVSDAASKQTPRGDVIEQGINSSRITLNEEQKTAAATILEQSYEFYGYLLDGVTGSGKTEVYLALIDKVVTQGRQALVLVPEISLTPQLTQRFQAGLHHGVDVLHSGLTDKQRLQVWQRARDGRVQVVIGTRSAITTPFPNLGLIIVDEEHDSSFKQQEGFRYSARDLAVMRAHILDIPVVLGSATPSFETLHNVNQGRYQHTRLQQRFGQARPPTLKVVDLRSQPMTEGLSLELREQMKQHLTRGNQVLLFINRRGFAPTLLCHDCGWIARCQRCDSHMTLHQASLKLRCHHCGAERRADPVCPSCQSSALIPVGEGTERVEKVLRQQFPDTGIIRIDRDTTRRKGSLESLLKDVHRGEARILVGTQMLAKGHHFPNVTLVGILNIDQGLFSVDFHALEKTAQLIVQVAGRAGREEKPGTVMLQTHYPDHPLLQTLLTAGYPEFARQAMAEREQANLPPYTFMALLRAESVDAGQSLAFLKEAKDIALEYGLNGVELWGPLPSPMEKRAGRYRAQLFVQSPDRAMLHRLLTPWIDTLEQSRLGRKVRWSIDVDPVDVY
ncbi:MAG: primosomal protein N' [Gammaproteobacteria bacterium]|jgi:primosomal protein N' (replication factor Y)